MNDGAPFGGSGGQYFVGRFDGKEFRHDATRGDTPLWIDFGKDFYASQTWNDAAEDGRPIWIAWMNNWQYANDIPTSPWRGAMTIPRSVSLRKTPDGLRLVQSPVASLKRIRGEHRKVEGRPIPPGEARLDDDGVAGSALELIAEFEPGAADHSVSRYVAANARRPSSASIVAPGRSMLTGRSSGRLSASAPISPAATPPDYRPGTGRSASMCWLTRPPWKSSRTADGGPDGPDFPGPHQSRRQPLRDRRSRAVTLARRLGTPAMSEIRDEPA